MIDPKDFFKTLNNCGIDFYAGVPDSLLGNFCAYVDDQLGSDKHLITANEGNAVAIAMGYHMATTKVAAVYMQNSGLGNTINPLVSLADPEVYKTPMLLIIGWRGEPGVKDEPQHIKQGRITLAQLDLMEIPYKIVDAESEPEVLAQWARTQLVATGSPVALLVRKDAFSPYTSKRKSSIVSTLKREQALNTILDLAGDAAIISTTGKTSREVCELRVLKQQTQRDFLTVGGMGHTASIALGVALGRPQKRVVCLDGDGSVLMHMGALPIIGAAAPSNLIHVLLNNAAHESVGGQPTVADRVDFKSIALASGYKAYALATNNAELNSVWEKMSSKAGPTMIEVRIGIGSREDLGRPTSKPEENKHAFMKWLST
jgi:phosphonopyruvate decarboxylase